MLFPNLTELIRLKAQVKAASNVNKKQSNRTHGEYTAILHGLGVEFETIRPYVIGDDVRYIDWRTTARTGKPQVKTFRAECDRNVFVVVDANAYMRFGTRGTFKSVQAAKVAAIMAWKSLQQQERVGGLVFGDIPRGMQYFKPSKSDSAALKMLRVLCDTGTDIHVPVALSTVLTHLSHIITPQSVVIIISDFSVAPTEELRKTLLSLRKLSKIILMPIYDPSDISIPDTGTIMCTDADQQIIIQTNNHRARQVYQKQWENYQHYMQQISKKMQISLYWIETTQDPVRYLWNS